MKYQFVWWGFRDMQWGRSEASVFSGLRAIYEWAYCFGPIEVRKWRTGSAEGSQS